MKILSRYLLILTACWLCLPGLAPAQLLLNPYAFPAAGGSFTPTDIAGLRLWLDASDSSTLFDATSGGSAVAADGQVARWEDKSGGARHFTQATSGSQPIRKTAIQNGRDVVRFDGTADNLATVTAGLDIASNLSGASLFIVRKYAVVPTTARTQFFVNTSGAAGLTRLNMGAGATSQKPYWGGRRLDANSTVNVMGATSATTGAELHAGIVDWVGTSLNQYVNGSLDGTNSSFQTSGTSPVGTSTAVFVGSASGSAYTNGDICEILFYGSALGSTDRASVEAYLKAKWGTP